MFGVASTTAVISQFFADTGSILTAILGTLLAATAGLLGLGFAVRHVKKWITGRKA